MRIIWKAGKAKENLSEQKSEVSKTYLNEAIVKEWEYLDERLKGHFEAGEASRAKKRRQ